MYSLSSYQIASTFRFAGLDLKVGARNLPRAWLVRSPLPEPYLDFERISLPLVAHI